MDRTEVSNEAFEPFARAAVIMGYPKPIYEPGPPHQRDADPALPVTAVDAYEAAAFCHYLGKELPTDRQWVKAARGGISVNGVPNPSPRRLYTWAGSFREACANIHRGAAGNEYPWMHPVDTFSCGESPYGFLNLLGNAEEWMSTIDQPDRNPLHALRGGSVDDNDVDVVGLDVPTTVFINHLNPRSLYYSIGMRCVENQ
jgi:formylglycine-generating enzyme required for sulfatase activity